MLIICYTFVKHRNITVYHFCLRILAIQLRLGNEISTA